MDYKVIMINPMTEWNEGSYTNKDSYMTQFLYCTLKSNGIDNFSLIPNVDIPLGDENEVDAAIVENAVSALDKDKLNIIGVSNYFSRITGAADILRAVIDRSKGYKIMTVAGGPTIKTNFKRKGYMDLNQAFFDLKTESGEQLYDGLVEGGLQGLVDIISNVQEDNVVNNGNRYNVSKSIKGYHTIEKRAVGKSKGAKINVLPIHFEGINLLDTDCYSIETMLTNYCNQGCKFCSTGSNISFNEEHIRKGVKFLKYRIGENRRPIVIAELVDPNPFSEKNIENTGKNITLLSELLNQKLLLKCYLDSHDFIEPSRVVKNLNDFDIIRYFIGRDFISEPSLSFGGSSVNGKVKTQEIVDQEREGIIEVLTNPGDMLNDLTISYVVSPLDSKENIQNMIDEFRMFQKVSTREVFAIWNILYPSPGTTVLRDNRELMVENPFIAESANDVWDEDKIEKEYPDSIFRKIKEDYGMFAGNSDNFDLLENLISE